MDISLSAHVNSLKIPEIVNNISINNSDFVIDIDKNGLNIKGDIELNKSQIDISYKENFAKNSTHTKLSSQISPLELQNFGLDIVDFTSGIFDIEIDINEENNIQNIIGKIDLKDLEIEHKLIGWNKKLGKDGILSFNISDDNEGNYTLKSFQLMGDDFIANGVGSLTSDYKNSELELDQLRFADNDFSLKLIKTEELFKVNLRGKHLDISTILESLSKSKSASKPPVSLDISAHLDGLTLAGGVKMNDVTSLLYCNLEYCERADFKGAFASQGSVDMSFGVESRRPDNSRYLIMRTDNAGELIKGLNFLKHIKGGTMELSAFAPEDSPNLQEGKIIIKDFRVIKASLLAKILTLGSFTGVFDLMEGNGIKFNKLKGEFSLTDRLLKVKDVKASGSSIGITVDGDIDTKNAHIHVDGAVIPAYTINSFLGKIPLLGTILVGKEGEGIIATRYKVKGNFGDPEVTVNPFSMLTPGFLRHIWGGKALE